MSLIIFCLDSHLADVTRAVDRFALEGWQRSGTIIVHGFDETSIQNRARIKVTETALGILSKFLSAPIVTAVLIRGPQIQVDKLTKSGVMVTQMTITGFLQHNSRLEGLIAQVGQSWKRNVIASTAHWAHAPVDIDAWLKQFNDLGGFSWVGEKLLKNLRFFSEASLGNIISEKISPNLMDRSRYGFFSNAIGKSGGVVSNLIKKRYPTGELREVSQCFEERQEGEILALVEDGLYTATEIVAVLDSLLGQRPAGRSQKTNAVSNPLLLKKKFLLVFGVTVDYGVEVLRHYLRINKDKIDAEIVLVGGDDEISVLCNGAISGSETMSLKEFRSHLRSNIVPWILQHASWGDRLDEASEICFSIGTGLWQSYVNDMAANSNWNLKDWPDDRIKVCAFGMEGLGLTVVFGHSVPKATLPVFWVKGEFTFRKKIVSWIPLFANA